MDRNFLPLIDRIEYSKMIADNLISSELFQNSKNIMIYASYQSEADTRNIIRFCLQNGKKVFCPKVLRPGCMEFYHIKALSDLIPGFKGIPEPFITHKCFQPTEDEETLMIMPMVSFDNEKNRLGYGSGFYDRYLEKYPFLKTIALGFECQKCEEILQTEPTDIKPHYIITEKQIY